MSKAGIETLSGMAAVKARGVAAKDEWVMSGQVVPSLTLAQRWGLTVRALGLAGQRGEIFALTHRGRKYYPSEFLDLSQNVVAEVSWVLAILPPKVQLVFWKRRHGSLEGCTVFETLSSRGDSEARLGAVITLARAWAHQAECDALLAGRKGGLASAPKH